MDKFIVDWVGMGEINYGTKEKGRKFFKSNRSLHEYRSLHFPRKHGYHFVLPSVWPISVGFDVMLLMLTFIGYTNIGYFVISLFIFLNILYIYSMFLEFFVIHIIPTWLYLLVISIEINSFLVRLILMGSKLAANLIFCRILGFIITSELCAYDVCGEWYSPQFSFLLCNHIRVRCFFLMFIYSNYVSNEVNLNVEEDYSRSWRVLQGVIASVSEGTVKAYGFNRSAIGIVSSGITRLSRKNHIIPFGYDMVLNRQYLPSIGNEFISCRYYSTSNRIGGEVGYYDHKCNINMRMYTKRTPQGKRYYSTTHNDVFLEFSTICDKMNASFVDEFIVLSPKAPIGALGERQEQRLSSIKYALLKACGKTLNYYRSEENIACIIAYFVEQRCLFHQFFRELTSYNQIWANIYNLCFNTIMGLYAVPYCENIAGMVLEVMECYKHVDPTIAKVAEGMMVSEDEQENLVSILNFLRCHSNATMTVHESTYDLSTIKNIHYILPLGMFAFFMSNCTMDYTSGMQFVRVGTCWSFINNQRLDELSHDDRIFREVFIELLHDKLQCDDIIYFNMYAHIVRTAISVSGERINR